MKDLIAIKRIGRTLPGERLRLSAAEARAMIALGRARLAPKEVPAPEPEPVIERPRRQYRRRDMTAETPVFVAEPASIVISEPELVVVREPKPVSEPEVMPDSDDEKGQGAE